MNKRRPCNCCNQEEQIDALGETVRKQRITVSGLRMENRELKRENEKLYKEFFNMAAELEKVRERNKFLEGEYKYYKGKHRADEWF